MRHVFASQPLNECSGCAALYLRHERFQSLNVRVCPQASNVVSYLCKQGKGVIDTGTKVARRRVWRFDPQTYEMKVKTKGNSTQGLRGVAGMGKNK